MPLGARPPALNVLVVSVLNIVFFLSAAREQPAGSSMHQGPPVQPPLPTGTTTTVLYYFYSTNTVTGTSTVVVVAVVAVMVIYFCRAYSVVLVVFPVLILRH